MSNVESLSRTLISNARTYNQLEIFIMSILDDEMQQGQYTSLNERILAVFSDTDSMGGIERSGIERSDIDYRDPVTLLNILMTNNYELFSQLFSSCVMAIKTIYQKFDEPPEPRMIACPILMVLQNLYPEKFTTEEFLFELQNIPYYTESPAVRQNINAFILIAAKTFCTIEHCQQIETLLLDPQ